MATYRKAVHSDLPGVMEILNEVVPIMNASGNFQWNEDYPTLDVLKRDIEDSMLWIAEIDNEIAGFTAITTDQPEEYGNVGWDVKMKCIVPHRMAVSPKYRGNGIAMKFYEIAEDLGRELNYPYLKVDTNERNPAMQNIFKKRGYEFCGYIYFKNKPESCGRFMCYQLPLK